MKELKCPKCGSVFSVDEADYASIVNQVKNAEVASEVNHRLAELHQQQMAQQKLAEVKMENEHQLALANKDKTISELRAQIAQSSQQQQIAVMEVRQKAQNYLNQKEQEITRLQSEVKTQQLEADSKMEVLKKEYEGKLKNAQDMVDYYKDLKSRMSTKMVGETLEIHCSTEFNRVRPLFPNAYFEKDNDARSGSKGDYIYREFDESGMELWSMFPLCSR